MKATFYKTDKKLNSTKIPTGGTEYDITLKTPSAIESPYITLQREPDDDYNYVYIPRYGRYYNILSRTAVSYNITGYQLECDPLASFRADILNATTYVTRSASDPDPMQYDSTWTHSGNKATSVTAYEIDELSSSEGMFILQTVSSSPTAGQGTSIYAVNFTGMTELINQLFIADNYDFDLSDEIQTYFNPFQYVVNCRYFPFSYGIQPLNTVKMGWYTYTLEDSEAYASPMQHRGYSFDFDFIPGGGDAVNFTNRSSEWTRFDLYVPGFGTVSIDPVYYGKNLTAEVWVDFYTGEATLLIKMKADGAILSSASGILGFNIQLSSLYADQMKIKEDRYNTTVAPTLNAFNIGASLVGSLLSGNVGGAISAVSSGVNAYHEAEMSKLQFKQDQNSPTLQSCGSTESKCFTLANLKAVLTKTFYTPRTYGNDYFGGACNAVHKLGDLSGYTQVANGNIECAGTASEKALIKSYLEGGFYIE